jgi:hypothetical protein
LPLLPTDGATVTVFWYCNEHGPPRTDDRHVHVGDFNERPLRTLALRFNVCVMLLLMFELLLGDRIAVERSQLGPLAADGGCRFLDATLLDRHGM